MPTRIYLRNSRYVPPRWEAVRDAMPALFDLIEAEREPSVLAVLAHWLFGYSSLPRWQWSNGRFLNERAAGIRGYPWTVIRVEDRADYLLALDRASIVVNVLPFASFIAKGVRAISMMG